MKPVRWFGPLVAMVMAYVGLSTAEGTLIAFQFGGEITSINDPGHYLDGIVSVGQTYSGQYTFDSQTLDAYPHDSTSGLYTCIDNGFSLTLGGVGMTAMRSGIGVGNNSYGDSYGVGGGRGTSWGDLVVAELGFYLIEDTGAVFPNDSLPLVPPDLNKFPSRGFAVQAGPTSGMECMIMGTVTYLVLVPEPCSLLLLALCAPGLTKKHFRRGWHRDFRHRRDMAA